MVSLYPLLEAALGTCFLLGPSYLPLSLHTVVVKKMWSAAADQWWNVTKCFNSPTVL